MKLDEIRKRISDATADTLDADKAWLTEQLDNYGKEAEAEATAKAEAEKTAEGLRQSVKDLTDQNLRLLDKIKEIGGQEAQEQNNDDDDELTEDELKELFG